MQNVFASLRKMFKKCMKLSLMQCFCCHVNGGSYLQIGRCASAAGTARC